ncbi:MAG: serpin family protein [Fimbriimonadaceae bacterium]|nr:serpin family protein [Fimbriimonadaceae bacterium]
MRHGWWLTMVGCAVCSLQVGGCSGGAAAPARDPGLVASRLDRQTNPAVAPGDLAALTAANLAFACDFYDEQPGGTNLFYSPHSISLAFAQVLAGARTTTASELAAALHFELPTARLHPACNRLDLELASRASASRGGAGFQLSLANALWGQQGYTFQDAFLDVLALHYGAGLRPLDFAAAPEPARRTINDWVSQQTAQKIRDLLPEGSIDSLTRFVLTNAIYFLAPWSSPFDPAATAAAPFTRLDGSRVSAPLMQQTASLAYAAGANWQAVEVPYADGQLALLLLLPAAGQFAAVAAQLDPEWLQRTVGALAPRPIALALPRFSTRTNLALIPSLQALGLRAAFDPGEADFSGIDGTRNLVLTAVVQQAYVNVDEAGTEAAAATGVVGGITSVPEEPVSVRADRPFLYLIRDRPTGAVLFVGRLVDPTTE